MWYSVIWASLVLGSIWIIGRHCWQRGYDQGHWNGWEDAHDQFAKIIDDLQTQLLDEDV